MFRQGMQVWIILDEKAFEEVPEDAYNRHAARGEEPCFRKDKRCLRTLEAADAAIDVSRGMSSPDLGASRGGAELFTLGGLKTGNDGEVLDVSRAPIPGLYAAGRAASGLHGQGYISGTSLGDGAFFGRRAGAAAAGKPVGQQSAETATARELGAVGLGVFGFDTGRAGVRPRRLPAADGGDGPRFAE